MAGRGGQRDQAPDQVPGPQRGTEDHDRDQHDAEAVEDAELLDLRPDQADDDEGGQHAGPAPQIEDEGVADALEQARGPATEHVDQREVVRGDRSVEGAEPAVSGAGDGGEGRGRGGGDGRHQRRSPEEAPTAPHLCGPDHRDRGQAEDRGHLDQRRRHDQDGAEHGMPLDGGGQAGGEQADHEGVVVGAAHEVDEHERVEHGQPQRGRRPDARAPGQDRQDVRQKRQPRHRDRPHRDHPAQQMLAAEETGDSHEDRAVRAGGVLPDRGNLRGDEAAETGRPLPVDVESLAAHQALREIAVDVTAEQGRREQQRRRPQGQRPPHRADVAGQHLAVPPPGEQQQGEPAVDEHETEAHVGHAGEEAHPDRQRTGAEAAHGDEHGPDEANGARPAVITEHRSTFSVKGVEVGTADERPT
ncbi:hypothetical protein SAMN05421748_103338 [Paractinoplanes atraurantiacus]|uniref:Uncharacterized protein n=1 Tax=Paractinoplanes atraurantiacus TaxID=1036182 RepID=A0A285H5E4_9ACTN|nr:hypothetical protein SAMN05421748_103338 [Actinoplanes atraurantiacus]